MKAGILYSVMIGLMVLALVIVTGCTPKTQTVRLPGQRTEKQ
jgi:hypothetical protein